MEKPTLRAPNASQSGEDRHNSVSIANLTDQRHGLKPVLAVHLLYILKSMPRQHKPTLTLAQPTKYHIGFSLLFLGFSGFLIEPSFKQTELDQRKHKLSHA